MLINQKENKRMNASVKKKIMNASVIMHTSEVRTIY